MTRPDYATYIASDAWRVRAEAAKDRVGRRCQVCYVPEDICPLDAHHRTYARLGDEDPLDLTVLCRDCHRMFEGSKRMAHYGKDDMTEELARIAKRAGRR